MERKLSKEDVFTIPNFLSAFRLLLIPVIMVLYSARALYGEAAAVVILSAVTDFADGRIARKYNMVTAMGKVLDPLADKLTQGAMMLCLVPRFRLMPALLALLIIKELMQLYLGWRVLKYTGRADGEMWCGKLSTGIIYAVMTLLFFFPHFPGLWAGWLLALCAAALLMSMGLYARRFILALRDLA